MKKSVMLRYAVPDAPFTTIRHYRSLASFFGKAYNFVTRRTWLKPAPLSRST